MCERVWKLTVGAVGGVVGSSAAIAQFLGGLSWPSLLTLAGTAGAAGVYIANQAAEAIIETRKARRESAISYLLDLDARI